MALGSELSGGKELDEELAGLLEVETFDPPAEFREHALLNDPGVYERGRARPARLVGRAGRAARVVQAVGAGPRRRGSAVLQVVHRRHAQRVAQLPGPSCDRGQGRPRRPALARRGRSGA